MNRAGRYLLSGPIRCGTCGGSMTANVQHSGKGRKRLVIVLCNRRNSRGKTACTNSLRIREEVLNKHVVEALQIPPQVIAVAARKALAKPKPAGDPKKQIEKLEKEQARLVQAIRLGGALEALVDALKACERSLEAARAERPAGKVVALGQARLERDAAAVVASWRRILTLGLPEVREMLRGALNGPVVITPQKVGALAAQGRSVSKTV